MDGSCKREEARSGGVGRWEDLSRLVGGRVDLEEGYCKAQVGVGGQAGTVW